jgi:hypothetical protein
MKDSFRIELSLKTSCFRKEIRLVVLQKIGAEMIS